MNKVEQNKVKDIPMYDLLDACCALQGGMELEKFEDKNYALKHALNRIFGYLTPEAKAEFNHWVDIKGWQKKESIISLTSPLFMSFRFRGLAFIDKQLPY